MTRPAPAPARVRPALATSLPHLREALLEQRRFRVQQLAQLLDDIRPGAPREPDPREEVAIALIESAAAALADVDTALRLMQTGAYGRCRQCAGPIPLERLEVLPALTMCMECQHRHEGGRR